MSVLAAWKKFNDERRIAKIFNGKQPLFADIMTGETAMSPTSTSILQSSRCDVVIPIEHDLGLILKPISERAGQQPL